MNTDTEGFQLPSRAPECFRELYQQWLGFAKVRPPTWAAFPFDVLVDKYPGVARIDAITDGRDLVDFKYTHAGPEYHRRTKIDPLGLKYSDFVHPRLLARCVVVFGQAMKTGEPHYWEVESSSHGYASTNYERLLLPMSDETGQCSSFLINCVWASV